MLIYPFIPNVPRQQDEILKGKGLGSWEIYWLSAPIPKTDRAQKPNRASDKMSTIHVNMGHRLQSPPPLPMKMKNFFPPHSSIFSTWLAGCLHSPEDNTYKQPY